MLLRQWCGAIMPCRQQKKSAGATYETSDSFWPMNAANRTFQQIITTIAPMVG